MSEFQDWEDLRAELHDGDEGRFVQRNVRPTMPTPGSDPGHATVPVVALGDGVAA